jgi:uncharacterized protein YjbI with pentapeptide repeats
VANEEHLQILKQGVEAWNTWRDQHRDIRPDLSTADLFGANLHRAALSRTHLNHANLRRATLTETNLSRTDFTKTDLTSADLSGANLSWAVLAETIFNNTNLTAVRGLETCYHIGPKSVHTRFIHSMSRKHR